MNGIVANCVAMLALTISNTVGAADPHEILHVALFVAYDRAMEAYLDIDLARRKEWGI